MSKYTTEVRFICEMAIPLSEQGDYTDIRKAIEAGRKRIFTFNYDLFDPLYKPVIETKFLRHFYTREIGQETVALWKLKLEDKWTMLLPYYNKLWETELLKFNPLYDVDYTIYNTGERTRNQNSDTRENGELNRNENSLIDETGRGTLTGTDTGESETVFDGNVDRTAHGVRDNRNTRDENLIDKFSDTPQGGLDGVIDTDWLTNARQNVNDIDGTDYTVNDETEGTDTDNTTNVTTSDSISRTTTDTKQTERNDRATVSNINSIITDANFKDIDDYQRHVIGKMGTKTYASMIKEFRDTFLNIDRMFINEMNDLFMLIY